MYYCLTAFPHSLLFTPRPSTISLPSLDLFLGSTPLLPQARMLQTKAETQATSTVHPYVLQDTKRKGRNVPKEEQDAGSDTLQDLRSIFMASLAGSEGDNCASLCCLRSASSKQILPWQFNTLPPTKLPWTM